MPKTFAVPVVVPAVKVTPLQDEVPAVVVGARVHVPVKVPIAVEPLATAKLTVPAGND
jgi:hypothetical protein